MLPRRPLLALFCLALSGLPAHAAHAAESRCYGTVAKGRLEGGVKLPTGGANFSAYSELAAAAGRTYVHAKVADVIVASYAALQARTPGVHYVYGETGWAAGGSFKPHRTHQNGLSVDFFVPVRDAQGRSVPLPTAALTRFGYDLEFDAEARHGEHRIDFPALAEHLYTLHRAARAQGVGIARVILDTTYLPALFATPRGPYLRQHLPFMKSKPWVRHDEHYHVDFALACRPG
ncbi:penicillin-insensitive murein endopeptidase [Roseateles cavernae]|uniref:penicillin-insensitive murein endopeptidase n=1 Tax=Roseateles cavernae TaxID=3153578 RepID=UPI0032E48E31